MSTPLETDFGAESQRNPADRAESPRLGGGLLTGPSSPKNILLLGLSGIGNLLMQSPTIALLKKRYPNAKLTIWVVPRGTKALAQTMSEIDHVIEAPIKASPVTHLRHSFQLSKHRFDTGLVLSPGQLWKSAAYLYLAGVPKRIGNSYPFSGKKDSRFLLTDAVPEIEDLHDIEQNLRLLQPLGLSYSQPVTYQLNIPPPNQAQADALLKSLSLPPDKTLIGLHPGSAPDFLWRRWPLNNFAQVCRVLIAQHNCHILILGGPEEKELREQLRKLVGQANSIDTDLLTTAGIISQCTLLLSNDSGLMHLSAAIGTPTISLFGPTDESKTGPRGDHAHVIRASGTKPVYHTELNYHLGRQPHESLLAIKPSDVLKELQQYL
ncbi:lipopolysaccharide heptosyltransferase II [Patescibacteria group bacterium]|nr:lipopolysaccharide heptosyltransferase II [Patescibacteria group bacterium]